MRSRLALAALSLGLGFGLPVAAGLVAERVTDRSTCDGFGCLGVFLVALAAGLLVGWVLWSAVAHACGQRLAVLVPPLAALTVWLAPPITALHPLPFVSAAGVHLVLLALAGAAWAAVLGPRTLRTAAGYGDIRS